MEPANGDFAHSLLVLPLVHGGQTLGAINLASTRVDVTREVAAALVDDVGVIEIEVGDARIFVFLNRRGVRLNARGGAPPVQGPRLLRVAAAVSSSPRCPPCVGEEPSVRRCDLQRIYEKNAQPW